MSEGLGIFVCLFGGGGIQSGFVELFTSSLNNFKNKHVRTVQNRKYKYEKCHMLNLQYNRLFKKHNC